MTARSSLLPLLASACLFHTAGSALAQGCISFAGESESISIGLGGGESAEVEVFYHEGLAESEDGIACEAWVAVPLSAFPTWRLATRPSQVAPAIRDLASRWGARECRVVVVLHNDTGEDVAEREECVTARFRYEDRDWWASSSEVPCDEEG